MTAFIAWFGVMIIAWRWQYANPKEMKIFRILLSALAVLGMLKAIVSILAIYNVTGSIWSW